MNGIWIRALPGPMHLGLTTDPLCPMFCTKLKQPCSFSKVPDGPSTEFPNILWVQKEGTQICMPERGYGLTQTYNLNDLWVQERNPHTLFISV